MSKHLKIMAVFAVVWLTAHRPALATGLALPIISAGDLDHIINDIGATYAHSSVSPASSLAPYFGIEVGVIGGITYTPNIYHIVNETSPTADVRYLPHADLLVAIAIPLGFKFEITILPQVTAEDVTVQGFSGAIVWNITDTILPLPFDLALRLSESLSQTSFSEVVSGTAETVKIGDINQGIDLIASINYDVVEPYIGFGGIKSYGKIETDGPNSLFSFTTNTAAATEVFGFEALLGVNVRYGHGVFGLEVANLFNDSRALAKLSMVF